MTIIAYASNNSWQYFSFCRIIEYPSVPPDKTCKFYICGIITKCNNFLAIIRIFGKKRVWCMEIGKKQSLFSEKREYIMTLNPTLLIFCPKNMYNIFFTLYSLIKLFFIVIWKLVWAAAETSIRVLLMLYQGRLLLLSSIFCLLCFVN